MEEEACYIFRPRGVPPVKRRRVEDEALEASLEARKRAYLTLWQRQEQQIHVGVLLPSRRMS